jgi:RimJ/RimL family protein N-acetyltransferase
MEMKLISAIDRANLYKDAVRRIRSENIPYSMWEDLRSCLDRDKDFTILVDDTVIGTISCRFSLPNGFCAKCAIAPVDISYFIFKEFRGNGYATGAVRMFIEKHPDYDLGACVSVNNPASVAVLLKNGFEKISKSEVPCLKGKNRRERAYRLIRRKD